jgi:hypothetical protein
VAQRLSDENVATGKTVTLAGASLSGADATITLTQPPPWLTSLNLMLQDHSRQTTKFMTAQQQQL